MAEYWVDPADGDDLAAGSLEAPWKLIPGQADSNTVSANDIINVKNGTTTTLEINTPNNGLTYRGYGLAANVLELKLPGVSDPTTVRTVRVAREWGVHEGMWTIDGTNNDVFGAGARTGTRTNCVFEDINILGPQVGDQPAFAFASSSSNVSGGTLRRFAISGATGPGITIYTKNVLLEYGRVQFTQGDNILLNTSTANVARADSVDTLRFLELRDPNRQIEGGADTGLDGDCFHLTPTGGLWDGTLIAHDILMDKSTGVKQAVVVHQTAAAGLLTMNNFHVTGNGNVTFLLGHIKNRVEVANIAFVGNYNRDAVAGLLPLFRFAPADTSPPAYGMDTGAVLRIKNITVNGNGAGFYRCAQNEVAQLFDGTLEIDGVTAAGSNTTTVSSAANFSFDGAGNLNTYGANFQLRIRNCAALMTGAPHIRMPAGTADSSGWQVQTNTFGDGTFVIGETTYADLAAFEAAHSAATGNNAGVGTHLEYTTDIGGTQRWNPPTIGARETVRTRNPRT